MTKNVFNTIIIIFLSLCVSFAQSDKDEKEKTALEEYSVSALKFRNIGPAFTSGRISDFAVNPDNPFEYYVATSSGGVWKTVNSGTTYKPIFDSQGSYSIGCVTMDPSNSSTIWVGTGENNNQRSVAYGDGIYKSDNGGKSWRHMGLKESEHIGKIIVHPDNSNVVFVAAIGPLWSSGGDRGLYKSTDGGASWNKTLEIDEHTGVTDLVMHPNNPDILYAASFQRARHVFTYLGGGPGSTIYKSTDGGETWNKMASGLPGVELGRIGLAVTPAAPDKVYAIVEAAEGKSGFYSTTNGGVSWDKQSSFVTSGNYYQEIIADPVDGNTIYAMDTWMAASHDGGKNFKKVGEDFKHVDNHCIWIDPVNNNHWLVGCDGGIYETFDAAATWSFKSNLPVTQFYKVAVDNDAPFYNIYGGTQDNFSMGGPSRTNTSHGIVNSDWYITHGGDGFESQVDPENPDIVYAQSQYGVLVRYDRKSGEEVGIQPKERKGENGYRWNWDAPLIASPHQSGRVYFAANKVFRSNDYGNSWEVISEDLTRQLNRNELEIMDRVWSMDAVAKNRSTSPYGTIVAMSESTINPDLIIVGTDDGLIQITIDGGANWRSIDNIKGIPERSYVNAVYASQHDENVIYAAFNHHKYGDFKPYIIMSSDQGKSWSSISNNLPERGSVYSIEEDHVDGNLIFCGTEFGIFFSPDKGGEWKQLKAGVPTIAVRDLAIQRRENDLVLGTFGRGFFVLDDYSPLRSLDLENEESSAKVFDVRPAYVFENNQPLGLPGKSFMGDGFYSGENLGSEAIVYYYYNEKHKSLKDLRKKKEKEEKKDKKGNAYPSYDELKAEREEISPMLLFTIKDASGNIIRKMMRKPSKGLQKLSWDLRVASKAPINLRKPSFYNPFAGEDKGHLVQAGNYFMSMGFVDAEAYTELAKEIKIEVKALDNRVMPADDPAAKEQFQKELAELSRSISGCQLMISELRNKMRHIKVAINQVGIESPALIAAYNDINAQIRSLSHQLNGDPYKRTLDIDQGVTPAARIGWIEYEQSASTAAPTKTHMDSYAIAKEEFEPILNALKQLVSEDFEALEQMLEDADAPYTPGRAIKMID